MLGAGVAPMAAGGELLVPPRKRIGCCGVETVLSTELAAQPIEYRWRRTRRSSSHQRSKKPTLLPSRVTMHLPEAS
jgi:hypothetical protein